MAHRAGLTAGECVPLARSHRLASRRHQASRGSASQGDRGSPQQCQGRGRLPDERTKCERPFDPAGRPHRAVCGTLPQGCDDPGPPRRCTYKDGRFPKPRRRSARPRTRRGGGAIPRRQGRDVHRGRPATHAGNRRRTAGHESGTAREPHPPFAGHWPRTLEMPSPRGSCHGRSSIDSPRRAIPQCGRTPPRQPGRSATCVDDFPTTPRCRQTSPSRCTSTTGTSRPRSPGQRAAARCPSRGVHRPRRGARHPSKCGEATRGPATGCRSHSRSSSARRCGSPRCSRWVRSWRSASRESPGRSPRRATPGRAGRSGSSDSTCWS